ncbi:hypothetical protein ACSBR2_039199 [Camellia fascicularis]
MEETGNIEVEIEDPRVGMTFNSINEIYEYYAKYAKQKGFAMSKKSSKMGGNGEKKYMAIGCSRGGKARIKTNNPVRLQPQTKIGCKAGLNAILQDDGMWMLRSFTLEHNHEICPGKSHFFNVIGYFNHM